MLRGDASPWIPTGAYPEGEPMVNAEKTAAVAEITEAFRDSSAAVLTEYRGLTVAQLKELRRSLAGNATYAVVKNTLTKIAMTDAGLPDLTDDQAFAHA